jgi:formate/nitrite transporter FocA (FNT family)
MRRGKIFVSAILAGICIAIGGSVFLSVENKVMGAVLFTAGLFTICTFGLHLFTGKVCYIFEKNLDYALDLPVIWLGNLAGTWGVAQLERCSRIGDALAEKAATLCAVKLGDNLGSIFILAAFCNVMIYIAVEGYNKNPHEAGKYLSLFFGVVVFILCGFEHCVANMYYFSVGSVWSGRTLLYLVVMTLGNAIGGVVFPLLRRWLSKTSKDGGEARTKELTERSSGR